MKKSMHLTFIAVLFSFSMVAQWSSDPFENTIIANASGEEVIPKIATSENGTTYISWFSSESGNYNVRLQKMDVYGNKQWADEGLLISNHPSMSWLTEWDMAIDVEEYAIITFQDVRNNDYNNIYAYRISPDGEFIWGLDGIELSNSTAFDVSPKVTVTNAGNSVFAWQSDDVIIIQKITPEGNLLWGNNGITLSGNNRYSWPQLLSVGNDDVILKFFDDSGPYNYPTRLVYAQRYDTDGIPVWTEDAIVSDAAGITAWTQILPFMNDGNDGFYIAWHDDRDMNNQSSIFVQHIGLDGSVMFIDDGVEASTNITMNHFDAHLALPSESDNIFVYWYETNIAQNNWGIYGQKLSSSGERLWTDNGKAFIDVSSTNVLPFAARNSELDMVVIYEESSTGMNAGIKAMRIDTDGNFVWAEEKIDLCSVQSSKGHSDANTFSNNQWIAVWEDNRDGNADIYGQNIQLDGTLGPVTTTGEVEIYPDTLICDFWGPYYVTIKNNTIEDVQIEAIYFEYGYCYFEDLPPMPNNLSTGDSLILDLYVNLGTDYQMGYVTEILNILIDTEYYEVVLYVDEDLLYEVKEGNNYNYLVKIFPNPSNGDVNFDFKFNRLNPFSLEIYNSLGTRIKNYEIENATEFNNRLTWNCTNDYNQKVPPCTYYYRIISDELNESGKIVVLE